MIINACSELNCPWNEWLNCPWNEWGKCVFDGTEGCILLCSAERIKELFQSMREGGEPCS